MKDLRKENFYEVFRVAYHNGAYADWFAEQVKINIPTYYRNVCGDIVEEFQQKDELFVKVTHMLGFTHARIERSCDKFIREHEVSL